MACIVLHNLCIEIGDTFARYWDIGTDDFGNQRRPKESIRQSLVMMQGYNQQRGPGAEGVREALKQKLWNEKEQ